MKSLWTALVFIPGVALACPADDVKDAQAPAQDKAVVEAKAPVRATTPAKPVAVKKEQTTKVADKSAVDTAPKSPL
jgi:hypothetical protein